MIFKGFDGLCYIYILFMSVGAYVWCLYISENSKLVQIYFTMRPVCTLDEILWNKNTDIKGIVYVHG